MRAVCVSFVVGIACLQQQAALFSVAQLCSLIAVALIIFVLIQRFISSSIRADRWRTGNRSALAFIVGFVWASLFAHYYLYSSLSPNWENKDLVLVGTVDSLPMHMAEGQRFYFCSRRGARRADDPV